MSQTTTDTHVLNYVTANRFYVEIESEITASFSECSGLGVKVKREAVFEGGLNDQQRILLGQAEFSDVTLKRGLTDDVAFWGWISQTMSSNPKDSSEGLGLSLQAGIDGIGSMNASLNLPSRSAKRQLDNSSRRRNINILLFNQAGETMQCWTLIGAVPIGWKAPALQATSNTVAIEELTLAYEGLRVVKSTGGGASYLDNQRDKSGFFPSH